MKLFESKMLITGLLFVSTLASGVWLSRTGKPYSSALFNLHKLIAVGAIVLTVITINNLRAGVEIRTMAVGAMIVAGLLFLFLIATGGMLSIGKPDLAAILTVHRTIPLLAVFFAAAAIYLVATAKPLLDF